MASLDTTPALQPPPGVTPQFTNPPSIIPVFNFAVGICLGVATLVVLLRMYTRLFIAKKHGLEDYTLFLAWLGFVGYCAIQFYAIPYGIGVHQWDVPLSKFIVFLQLGNIDEIYYNPLIFLTKLSILIQFIHIFCPSRSGGTYRMIIVIIVLNFLFYFAVMLAQIMACLPREKIWNPSIPGQCISVSTIFVAGAVVNVVSDISIFILPVYRVWNLKMTRTRKWGVSAVFASGLFGCISSIIRLANNIQFTWATDITWELTPIALWTVAELTSGIICASLPVMPLLYRHFYPKLRSAIGQTFEKPTKDISNPNAPRSLRDGWAKKGAFHELSDFTTSSQSDDR